VGFAPLGFKEWEMVLLGRMMMTDSPLLSFFLDVDKEAPDE
jgi:hypothetical protein